MSNKGYSYEDIDASKDEGVSLKLFSKDVKRITVGEEILNTVEYDTDTQMEYDASYFSEDGSSFNILNVSATTVVWISKPNFFKKDRIIVNYIGEDEVKISLLAEILGKSFTL